MYAGECYLARIWNAIRRRDSSKGVSLDGRECTHIADNLHISTSNFNFCDTCKISNAGHGECHDIGF